MDCKTPGDKIKLKMSIKWQERNDFKKGFKRCY